MSNIDKRFNSSTAYGKSDSEQTQHHLDLGATERASEMLLFELVHAARTETLVAARNQRKSCVTRSYQTHLADVILLLVNCWLCTMRSVSAVRNTFLKSSLSILFRLLHFPVPRFPPLQSGAAFSTPAFSTPAFLLLPRFPVPRFQRPLLNFLCLCLTSVSEVAYYFGVGSVLHSLLYLDLSVSTSKS